MEQPRNESVTRIKRVNGKWEQSYLADNLTYGEAMAKVWKLRRFMNQLVEVGLATEDKRTYYRLGRPH